MPVCPSLLTLPRQYGDSLTRDVSLRSKCYDIASFIEILMQYHSSQRTDISLMHKIEISWSHDPGIVRLTNIATDLLFMRGVWVGWLWTRTGEWLTTNDWIGIQSVTTACPHIAVTDFVLDRSTLAVSTMHQSGIGHGLGTLHGEGGDTDDKKCLSNPATRSRHGFTSHQRPARILSKGTGFPMTRIHPIILAIAVDCGRVASACH